MHENGPGGLFFRSDRKLRFFKQNWIWIAATKSNRLFNVKNIGFKFYFIEKTRKIEILKIFRKMDPGGFFFARIGIFFV